MADEDQSEGKITRLARCPICSKPSVEAFRPFCSKRCADVDLNRWLGGQYALPAEEVSLSSDDESER
ncbi:MAG: DNA gyrase inhibitor YacG [Beijerinckiaceae bacterium]|jgi:hypothetical protein|nr:DNA gyrase inhibitor YacG [Beijerinckiaceae bacterium]